MTEGGASGSHDDGSQVLVTSDELPLDSQRMTMARQSSKISHFTFTLLPEFSPNLQKMLKEGNSEFSRRY